MACDTSLIPSDWLHLRVSVQWDPDSQYWRCTAQDTEAYRRHGEEAVVIAQGVGTSPAEAIQAARFWHEHRPKHWRAPPDA